MSPLHPEGSFPRHPHCLLPIVFVQSDCRPFKEAHPFKNHTPQHFQSLTQLCIFLGVADLLRLYNLVYFLSFPFKCDLHKGRDVGLCLLLCLHPLEG